MVSRSHDGMSDQHQVGRCPCRTKGEGDQDLWGRSSLQSFSSTAGKPVASSDLKDLLGRTVWSSDWRIPETLKDLKCLGMLGNRSCWGCKMCCYNGKTGEDVCCFWCRQQLVLVLVTLVHRAVQLGVNVCNANSTKAGQPPAIHSWDEGRSRFPVFLRKLPTSFPEANYFKSTVAHVRLQLT